MKSGLLLLLLLLFGLSSSLRPAAATAQAGRPSGDRHLDFVQAMRRVTATQSNNNKTNSKIAQRLLERARPRPVLDNNDKNQHQETRFLADQSDSSSSSSAAGFDLRDYAFKYVGCQTIQTWSDELADDEEAVSVLASKRFVVFRLCPGDECSNYNNYGCAYNYGEYMLELEDYLEIMAQYHLEQYEAYCGTCLECMMGDGTDSSDGSATDSSSSSASSATDSSSSSATDSSSSSASSATDSSSSATDSTTAVNSDCVYAEACANYQTACANYDPNQDASDQSSSSSNYQEYLECTGYNVGNNMAYLGPHCNDDGKTMSIGIYFDENCYTYIGNIINLEEYTGMSFDDDSFDFFTSKACVSCSEQESYGLYQEGDQDNVYEVCEVLYDASAKCNRHLDEADRYWSDIQEETETTVCSFIGNLIKNTYNEFGEIAIRSASFDLSNWRDPEEYKQFVTDVTPWQTFMLVLASLTFLGILVYACVLQSKLRKRGDLWSLGRGDDVSRKQSGILMGRSGSLARGAYA